MRVWPLLRGRTESAATERTKAKGPNKYELFGPFLRLHRSVGAGEVVCPAERRAQGVPATFLWFHRLLHRPWHLVHRSGRPVHKSHRELCTTSSGSGGSGSQNARAMSTAPEGRSGVPSSR